MNVIHPMTVIIDTVSAPTDRTHFLRRYCPDHGGEVSSFVELGDDTAREMAEYGFAFTLPSGQTVYLNHDEVVSLCCSRAVINRTEVATTAASVDFGVTASVEK